MREKKKWENFTPIEKRRPPDEFYDLKQLANSIRIEVVAKDSTINVIKLEEVGSQEPDAIIKYLFQEGSGTLI
jgi:hypothetical protein